METKASPHPLTLAAAGTVIVAALAATAHFLGWLPGSQPVPTPAVVVSAPPSTTAPAVPTAPNAAIAPESKSAAKPEAKPVHRPAAKSSARPAATSSTPTQEAQAAAPSRAAPLCRDCGVVESVREVETQGEGTGLGAVAGGVVGGVLGHQVGKGRGKDVATVIGGLGGAVAGHQIEKKVRSEKNYEVSVRFEDGSRRNFSVSQANWRPGDRVRVVDNTLQAQ